MAKDNRSAENCRRLEQHGGNGRPPVRRTDAVVRVALGITGIFSVPKVVVVGILFQRKGVTPQTRVLSVQIRNQTERYLLGMFIDDFLPPRSE